MAQITPPKKVQEFLNKQQSKLSSYDSKLKDLEPFYNMLEVLGQGDGQNRMLPANFTQNPDFIKGQADEYKKILNQKKLDQDIFDQVNKKYNTYTGGDTLKTSVKKASQDFDTAEADIMGKIAGLGNIFGNEKNELIDRINQSTENLKLAASAKAQEEQNVAEGLTTRRGYGTKSMEDVTRTNLQNKELQETAAAEQAGVNQIQQAIYLYNQLLAGLLDKYKATKDTYTLGKIQNAVNILTSLKQYGSSGSVSGSSSSQTAGATGPIADADKARAVNTFINAVKNTDKPRQQTNKYIYDWQNRSK